MRDVKFKEEKKSNAGLVFAVLLTVVVCIYVQIITTPKLLTKVPGIQHYQTQNLEKTNEQKRRDSHQISEADRDALNLLLEAVK